MRLLIEYNSLLFTLPSDCLPETLGAVSDQGC